MIKAFVSIAGLNIINFLYGLFVVVVGYIHLSYLGILYISVFGFIRMMQTAKQFRKGNMYFLNRMSKGIKREV
jgi:hypothetical protein